MLVPMTLTPADVRSTDFPAASRLRRGYDADEVDAFIESIAVRLETDAGLSSNDVYHVSFSKNRIGSRGYSESDVDSFLERVQAELSGLEESWTHANAADGPPADEPIPADGEAVDEISVDDAPGEFPTPDHSSTGGSPDPAVR